MYMYGQSESSNSKRKPNPKVGRVGINNNYSPKWRLLAVVISEAAKRRGKYPLLATDTEVNDCFSMY